MFCFFSFCPLHKLATERDNNQNESNNNELKKKVKKIK